MMPLWDIKLDMLILKYRLEVVIQGWGLVRRMVVGHKLLHIMLVGILSIRGTKRKLVMITTERHGEDKEAGPSDLGGLSSGITNIDGALMERICSYFIFRMI